MKKFFAILTAIVLLCTAIPVSVSAEPVRAAAQRTEKLDLTAITAATANDAEGWSFDPTGDDGNPLLTLNNYGTASAHSAPILCPQNTKIVVNGDCYVDNAVIGSKTDVISGTNGGYLKIEGTGTLSLFANQYIAKCITLPMGSKERVNYLYINDLTINCYGTESTSTTAASNQACIYSSQDMQIRNATINTQFGVAGLQIQGVSVTGGVTETNCSELLIENSTVNIQNTLSTNNWNYARGIQAFSGKITITGDSNVTINAGTNSIYTLVCFTIEGGSVHICSTPVSTANSAAIVYVKRLAIGADIESVYFATTRYPLSKAYYCTVSGTSTLADGPVMAIGTFEDGTFATAADPNNGGLSTLKIVRDEPAVITHTVSFYGYGGELIAEVEVEDGTAATAPAMDRTVNTEKGVYVFCGWDTDFDNVTEDMQVNGIYSLLGDVNFDDTTDVTDALLVLRHTMGTAALGTKAQTVGDINGDGILDSTDAILIMRMIMGQM